VTFLNDSPVDWLKVQENLNYEFNLIVELTKNVDFSVHS